MSNKDNQRDNEGLELVNGWKADRRSTTNAERLGRPPTKKEISARKWRSKALASVKNNTVGVEDVTASITDISLRFLESWNEYCSGMEQLNEHVYKSFFKSSVEAGKRMRAVLRRQKKLIVFLQKASLEFEHHLLAERKRNKEKASWDKDHGEDQTDQITLPKFVVGQCEDANK